MIYSSEPKLFEVFILVGHRRYMTWVEATTYDQDFKTFGLLFVHLKIIFWRYNPQGRAEGVKCNCANWSKLDNSRAFKNTTALCLQPCLTITWSSLNMFWWLSHEILIISSLTLLLLLSMLMTWWCFHYKLTKGGEPTSNYSSCKSC